MAILTGWITEWLKELLIDGIMNTPGGLFDMLVHEFVGKIIVHAPDKSRGHRV